MIFWGPSASQENFSEKQVLESTEGLAFHVPTLLPYIKKEKKGFLKNQKLKNTEMIEIEKQDKKRKEEGNMKEIVT